MKSVLLKFHGFMKKKTVNFASWMRVVPISEHDRPLKFDTENDVFWPIRQMLYHEVFAVNKAQVVKSADSFEKTWYGWKI